MSLFADTVSGEAIVGLGCSCQTAYHLNNNQPLFRRFGPYATQGSYFDHIITPLDTTIRFIERGISYLDDPAKLVWNDGAYWADETIWFVHYFSPNIKPFDPMHDPSGSLAKIAYLREKFEQLRRYERLVFVISNTQFNLRSFCRTASFQELFGFDQSRIETLNQVLFQKFGPRYSSLVVVENPRTRISRTPIPNVHSMLLDEERETHWTGDSKSWKRGFAAIASNLFEEPLCAES